MTLDAMSESNNQSSHVWFGTRGEAIFHAELNTKTGELSEPSRAAELKAPGFVCINRDNTLLYSLASAVPADQNNSTDAEVAVFRIRGDKLKFLGSATSNCGKGTHLSLSRDERTLLVAHYGAGKITSFALDEEGQIKDPVSSIAHEGGSGVNPDRQASPHPHWIGCSPDGKFVMVPDLGLDQVVVYSLDESTHELSKQSAAQVPPGAGPRHFKFHPNGEWAYVLNELELSVTSFDYNAKSGSLVPRETTVALPKEDLKDILTLGSEIRIHPTGKFLYAGIRGHDVIAVFSINDAGELTLVEREPIRGSWPRNFNIDPSGKWLLAAGGESDSISVFSIDPATGTLTFTRQIVSVPQCICVEFSM